jgi:hypothetical protein
MKNWRILITVVVALLGLAPTLLHARQIPDRLTDQAFWHLVTEFSEPSGEFPSENFVSNELTFQSVIPRLIEHSQPGGVYLGVGPEQNFTYIVALQPKIAFIVDIRRQNMVQHLMYKALIEMSADRADFLSRLFSRKRPEGVGPASSASELFAAYTGLRQDPALFDNTLAAIKKHLVETHEFPLTFLDENAINFILSAFFFGPGLTYDGPGNRPNMTNNRPPTFAELMVQTDGAAVARSYLASEENFRILQDLERRNMIVPVVGNFSGEHAIRRIGEYLKARDATVTAFYLSNVEQYLFQQEDDWKKFYRNVETLPLNSASTFIRSLFSRPANRRRSVSLLSPIQNLLTAFRSGAIANYADVIALSN